MATVYHRLSDHISRGIVAEGLEAEGMKLRPPCPGRVPTGVPCGVTICAP